MIARVCDACDGVVCENEKYIELLIQVKDSGDDQDQDPSAQSYRDYCVACVRNGKATAHLLTQLPDDALPTVDGNEADPLHPPQPRAE